MRGGAQHGVNRTDGQHGNVNLDSAFREADVASLHRLHSRKAIPLSTIAFSKMYLPLLLNEARLAFAAC